MNIQPITLTGQVVQLEPLSENHLPDLSIAGKDESIWRYMIHGTINTEACMRTWVQYLINRQTKGTDLPFAVIHLETNQAIGVTRYLNIHPDHRGVEIGGTWMQ